MNFYAGVIVGLCLGGPFGLLLGCLLSASSRMSLEEEREWARFSGDSDAP